MTELLPCPFCGKKPDLEDPDTLYPNGTGWKDGDVPGMPELRSYCSFREVPSSQWCYSVHCPTQACGCGAEISGDTQEEAIENWNRRAENPEVARLREALRTILLACRGRSVGIARKALGLGTPS